MYYGIEHDLDRDLVKEIGTENKLAHIKSGNGILKAL